MTQGRRGGPQPCHHHPSMPMSRIRVTANPPKTKARPTARPLTHHEILRLMGPFTARGRHLDMGATRRAERELRFEPIDHPPTIDGARTLREHLTLQVSERGGYQLLRQLTLLTGEDTVVPATLMAAGPDVAVLLDEIERFPVDHHFRNYDGVWLQRSYRLESGKRLGDSKTEMRDARLVDASAEVAGVRIDFDAEVRGLPIEVRLRVPSGQRLVIPRDLLAVLGWHWQSLREFTNHWRSSIRVAKREPYRTSDIEDKLARTVHHLAKTLSHPPEHFHASHTMARWRAACQAGIPLFAVLGLVVGALALAKAPIQNDRLLTALAFHAPPVMLLVFFFTFDHLPDFEIPRVPRALKQDTWLVSARS